MLRTYVDKKRRRTSRGGGELLFRQHLKENNVENGTYVVPRTFEIFNVKQHGITYIPPIVANRAGQILTVTQALGRVGIPELL